MEKLETKLKQDFTLIVLKDKLKDDLTVKLVGGAVIDILEGREPKDYDILYNPLLKKHMDSHEDFRYVGVSNTAITYIFQGNKVIQLLLRDIESFEYTISQAMWDMKKEELTIDLVSFEQKTLIPTKAVLPQKTYTINMLQNHGTEEINIYQVYDALRRIPHYERKGYELPEVTYQTLLSKLYNSSKDNINS